jgi:predicted aspartyl protease
LADGTELELGIAVAKVEFMGDLVGTTVIFGPDDAEPILSVTALESVGISVDPRTQSLKRLPAVTQATASSTACTVDDTASLPATSFFQI